MQPFDFGTQEMRMLWASALLGLVQLLLAALFSVGARGLPWAVGPRDEAGKAMGKMGGRLDRAYRNFLETFALFASMVLLASALGRHSSATVWGAQLYFYGRVVYVPVYAFGVPFVRTFAWTVAILGVVLVMLGIWPGI